MTKSILIKKGKYFISIDYFKVLWDALLKGEKWVIHKDTMREKRPNQSPEANKLSNIFKQRREFIDDLILARGGTKNREYALNIPRPTSTSGSIRR